MPLVNGAKFGERPGETRPNAERSPVVSMGNV
jgi:hypothetical protein